ncbi:MAG: DUF456 domain-containing protein [Nocardioidaceae bacterium]
MNDAGLILVGLGILVGVVGVVIPVLPGALLVIAAILVWALELGTTVAWMTFGVATVFVMIKKIVKFVLPGRQMRNAGVPRSTLFVAALVGIVGFFVIPVLGLFVGFVAGAYLAERRRLGTHGLAWPSTRLALTAVGRSILIDLTGALMAAGTWLVGVFLTH